jgi:hypothetical protein
MRPNIDVMKREWKNLEFGREENQAQEQQLLAKCKCGGPDQTYT